MPSFLTLPAALSPDQCDSLIGLVQASDMAEARVVGGTDAPQIRRAEVAWLDDIPAASWVMDPDALCSRLRAWLYSRAV